MFKKTLAVLAASLFIAGSASATTAPIEDTYGTIECYPLAHGENGQGSRSSVRIPSMLVSGSAMLELFLTNIGEQAINVTLELYDEDGNRWVPAPATTYAGKFSASNSPIRQLDGTGAAQLSSLEAGFVRIDDNTQSKLVHGVLNWQADKCLSDPMLSVDASIYYHFPNSSTRDSTRAVIINGGKPF